MAASTTDELRAEIRAQIIDKARREHLLHEVAVARLSLSWNDVAKSVVGSVLEDLRREAQQNTLLDSPRGVTAHIAEDEVRQHVWYTGPEPHDAHWSRLRRQLLAGDMREVVDDIDKASNKVVGQLANPHVHNLTKQGLVLGYVQSGKTANFTAVMAKAADAGYRFFIVLSGLHNNLRQQTQARLEKDLGDDWYYLTKLDADFGGSSRGAVLFSSGTIPVVAVIKKNTSRLTRMIEWLESIPEDIRTRTPILILDDEADQATPNSASQADKLTKINELVRELWAATKTGTYVGYTATPFANVFMDPNDEEELYPKDFIIDLPRPAAYYGAERIFGREPLSDNDDVDDGLDMVRNVPDDEAAQLKPPTNTEARTSFNPELPASLEEAVRWFIIATAIRHSRGHERAHSSMLIHTTHYATPHFALKNRVNAFVEQLQKDIACGEWTLLRASFEREVHRVPGEADFPAARWDEIQPLIATVSQSVRVFVDNGYSDDRLTYSSEAETVIAIGGGTLSRGLTLEGLVVSYFIRTSNTYDTLLQMGRWFGYRVGYEDLPRIWMQKALKEEFMFLALVEEEIRQTMASLERTGCTPKQFGIRVRAHPGRLEIVSRNKMRHATLERVSFSGERVQTIIFDEDQEVLTKNLISTRRFLAEMHRSPAAITPIRAGRWITRGVSPEKVADFVDSYIFHEDQTHLRHQHIAGWIRDSSQGRPWNVVIAGKPLGPNVPTVELGLTQPVGTVTRAPLTETARANIKSMLSHADWFADLDDDALKALTEEEKRDPRGVRRRLANGAGLMILMPIDKDSEPRRRDIQVVGSRREMHAPEHIIGLGLVFPDIDRDGVADEGNYYAVKPDWEPTPTEDDDDQLLVNDTEASTSDEEAG